MRLNEQAAVLRSEERLGEAIELSEQALAIFRTLGDTHGTALTLNGLGLTQARIGDEAGALDSYETAVSLLTELGDSHGAGRVLANLGALHRGQGHDAQARAAWNEALERFEPGRPSTTAWRGSSGSRARRSRAPARSPDRRRRARREPTHAASSPARAARSRPAA